MKNVLLFLMLVPTLLFSQSQIGDDLDGEAANDLFGEVVSMSPDGSLIAIASTRNNTNTGYVRVYKKQSGSWVKLGNDIDGKNINDFFGSSLDLSSVSVASIVIIGSPGRDSNTGNVTVFAYSEFTNGEWLELEDIVGEATADNFGTSVSLSSDGNILAVGAPLNNGSGSGSGHVRVYHNQSDNWVQLGSDIDGEASGDQSGTSVSLSSDGTVLVVGAPFNNGSGSNSGHVRIYKYQSNTWVQKGSDINGESAQDQFGTSVSLSSDGNTLVVGGPQNNGNGPNSGHARVFDLSLVLSSNDFVLQQFSVFPNPATDVINVQIKENIELKRINIYNSLGQFISSTTKTTIPTNNLSKGYYFVEVETNNGKASKSVIIK